MQETPARPHHFFRTYRRYIAGAFALVLLAPLLALFVSACIVDSYKTYVLPAKTQHHVKVGVVLGAGIAPNGKPFKELEARLDVAAKALQNGTVDKLILSGDNRFLNYNEPQAMQKYMVEKKHISADKLQPDYAGRSTYESCERASKVFGLQETIIFSAESHLPRAIFLCRHFGIQAYGISSGVEADNSGRRELLAGVKAMYNVYVSGENTVLGKPIEL